ncbi:MAG: hypothetical protein F6K19_36710 [Cyanothece sp. SIO1E1]|nr:hypothetical protein [Cyanothece sp. SIO1E1]
MLRCGDETSKLQGSAAFTSTIGDVAQPIDLECTDITIWEALKVFFANVLLLL